MTTPIVTRIKDDTGRSSTDFLTFDNIVDIEGSAAANAAVEVTVTDLAAGTDRVFNVTANATGVWIVPQITLPNGNSNVVARVPDGSGGFLQSTDQQIVVDPNPPLAPTVVSINSDTGVAPNDAVTSDPTLIIEGTAHPDSFVTVFLDGQSLGTATPSALGVWSFNLTGTTLKDGDYSVDLVAQSPAGVNASSAQPFKFTVDTTTPVKPVVLGVTNDTGVLPNDGVTTDQTLVFNGTAEANSFVGVFLNGSSIGGTRADAQGNWSFDHSGTVLAVGKYNVTATSGDIAGNTSTSAVFALDIQPVTSITPTITGIRDDTGFNSADGITADQTLLIQGTSAPGATVEVSLNGLVIGTAATNAQGVWTFDHTATTLAPGGYVATAVTLGAGATRSSVSSPFNIQVDTAPPATPTAPDLLAVSDSGVSNSDNITNAQGLIITTTSEAGSTVTLFSSRDGQIGTGVVAANGTVEFRGVQLTEGVHDVTAVAEDAAGNRTGSSVATQITVDRTAPTPAPSIVHVFDKSGKANKTGLTGDNTPEVAGTSVVGETVKVTSIGPDGTVRDHGTAIANQFGNFWFKEVSEALADGNYTFTATRSDVAGNTSTSSPFVVTIDTVAPQTPTITFTNDTGTSRFDGVTRDANPTFSGTAAPNQSVDIFSKTKFGGGKIGSVAADQNGNWSFKPTVGFFSSDDEYTITAVVSDAALNTASASLKYTLDTTAPLLKDLQLQESSDTGARDNVTGSIFARIELVTEEGDVDVTFTTPAGVVLKQSGRFTAANSNVTLPAGQELRVFDVFEGTSSNFKRLSKDVSGDITARVTDKAGNFTERTFKFGFNASPSLIELTGRTVPENSPAGTIVGTIKVTDPTGPTDIKKMELTDDAGGLFEIEVTNPATAVLKVAAGAVLDYETQKGYTLEFVATDSSGASLLTFLAVDVTDVPESFGGSNLVDTITGDGAANVIDAGQGDDTVSGGGKGDTVTLGTGFDLFKDLAANFDGDVFTDFGIEDLMVLSDLELDRSRFTFGADGVVSVDTDGDGTSDVSFTLQGDFSVGDFMVVGRGGESLVSFETFLPSLGEGKKVQQSDINGTNNQAFLTGDGDTGFRVTLNKTLAGAGFDNALGVYEVDSAGTIVDVRMLYDNVKDTSAGAKDITGVEDGNKLGFFLVQDGANWAKELASTDTLEFRDLSEGDRATTADGGDIGLAVNGVVETLTIFHSVDASLNPDGLTHVLSGVDVGGTSLTMGFEDLLNAGDSDFQDAVFSVGTFDIV